MSSDDSINARPGPIRPIEGPIYAVAYDDLAKIYNEAKSLERRVTEKLLSEAMRGECMEALFVNYALNVPEGGTQPPVPPDDFDYLSIVSMFRNSQFEGITRGKAALIQRPNQLSIDRWTTDLSTQGIHIYERTTLDLSRPEHINRLCTKFFMLPEESVWKRLEKDKLKLAVIPESDVRKLEPLIILGKMNVNLGWCLEGSKTWLSFVDSF